MARTKSLATLILQHSDDRSYKLTKKKIPQIYTILNRHIFLNKLNDLSIKHKSKISIPFLNKFFSF